MAVPDHLAQEEKRAARWLNIALVIIVLTVSIAVVTLFIDAPPQNQFIPLLLSDIAAIIAAGSVWGIAKRGLIQLASFILLATLFSLVTYTNIVSFDGIERPSILIYIAMIPLVGLLMGRRSMNLFALLCVVTINAMSYFTFGGKFTLSASIEPAFKNLYMLMLLVVTNTILLNVSIRRAEEKTEEYQQAATTLAKVNEQLQISQTKLQQAQAELEQRVAQRTEELQHSNTKLHAEIEERQRAQNQLAYDAMHDALTGLPNRALFMDRLQHASALVKLHESYRFTVLFLDLDHFKVVNDSLGHTIGDQLLIAIAKRLRNCLHMSHTIARLGGDEFVILIEGSEDERNVTNEAYRIQSELKMPFNLEGHQVVTSASIGIVIEAHCYEQPEDALRDADIAMYQAKRLGKARFEIFKPYMRDQALARLELETDLRHALERKELELYYQPIVWLATEQITGFEALLRWRSPTRGLVNPTEFIPIAEETGLIVPIGQWVIHEACLQIRTWQEKFPKAPPLTVSVNISGHQFFTPDFVAQVSATLKEVDVAASSLKLEITEGTWLHSSPEVTAIFKKMNEMGIQFHIDDFGTGYSSLSYLQDFPIHAVKIDRSFVSRMGDNSNHTEIVRAVITMAHDLGMEAVAEGVETIEQLAQLKALGCNFGQGYLLSRPVDSSTIEHLLDESFTVATSAFNATQAACTTQRVRDIKGPFVGSPVILPTLHQQIS
ncbi:MAG: EAL domain-containing protein [Caldilineaceae bacterium]